MQTTKKTMMNKDLTGLLNLAYEIEGLLMLHIGRGEEAAPEMGQLLTAKAEKLLAGLKADSCADDTHTESQEDEIATTFTVAGASCGEAPAVEAEKDVTVVEQPAPTTAPVTVSEAMAGGSESEKVAEAAVDTTEADDEAVAENAIAEETADADVVPTVNDTLAAETQLTLDEKLARERAADISKAFTLNDRFRFRRELFRNSDDEFRETLEAIGSMVDMDEAEDYFFNDLCWDSSDPVVKEFMAIVAKHF